MTAENRGSCKRGEPTLVRVVGVRKQYAIRGTWFRVANVVTALDGVELTIREGQSLALVGESGCGKSTLASCIAGLDVPTGGSIHFRSVDIAGLSFAERRQFHSRVQIVPQDTPGSFNPRFTLEEIVAEPLVIRHDRAPRAQRERVCELLQLVHLPPELMNRTADCLSGGQRQRLAIARALALDPDLLILDEAFSGLDLWTQKQIARLLAGFQSEKRLALLHIVHDLLLAAEIADEIAVMHRGVVVERGTPHEILNAPRQSYTRSLVSDQVKMSGLREGAA